MLWPVWRWSRLISLIAWQFLIGAIIVVLVWDVLRPRGILLAAGVRALLLRDVGRLIIRVVSSASFGSVTYVVGFPLRSRLCRRVVCGLRGGTVGGRIVARLAWRWSRAVCKGVGGAITSGATRVAFRRLPGVRVVSWRVVGISCCRRRCMRWRAVVVCRVAWGRRWVCLEGCHRYGEASRRASRVVIVVSSGSEGLVSANVVVSIEADSEGRKIESLGSFVRTWRCCCSDL